VPLLDRIEKYLREQQGGALPKSQYGQAIAYALNHWQELLRYTEDGRLEIQADETPVPVLDRSRDSTRQGYIWTRDQEKVW
jgi:hypothetical protein